MSPFGQKRQRRTNRNCQSLWRRSHIVTHEETEKKMDELARKYVEARDPEIREELYRLSRKLENLEKK
jgi:hypothetical protein